jgi:asparagine synthase (glutamine-hydrolysing)
MPGLVGYISAAPSEGHAARLQTMLKKLEPESGYQFDVYNDSAAALGRATLGVFNPEPQPIWNAAHTRCILFEGELFDTNPVRQSLEMQGVSASNTNDAGLTLLVHETLGAEGIARLNGGFAAVIWEPEKQKLYLINDRMNQYPLYYAHYNGHFAFGSGVRALLADPDLPRRTDQLAIAQYLTFDHLLFDHTLLESVKLLQQASILEYDLKQNRVEIHPYFRFSYPDIYPLRDEQEYTDEFIHLMEQAVARQSQHNQPLGILLSGGLDSRFILPYLYKYTNQHPLHGFTWGSPDCDDLKNAREIAKLVGINHHFFQLQPDWLAHRANEAVRITDGMGNIVNLHALATLDQEVQHARVIYKGFLGDAMMGFALRPQFWANYDADTLPQVHLQVHTDQGVITFNHAERQQLFTPDFQANIQNGIMDEYMSGMLESGSSLLADQRNYFDYRQRVPRMTIKGVEVVRNKAMVRLPFCDNDLIDFALRLPPGLRYERRLMRNAFIQAFPRLAQVPTTPFGLPMTSCAREIGIRTERLIRWHLINRGLLKGPYTERKPYANYHLWFRTILRDWVESTLLSKRALGRGYFEPAVVRKVIQEHMQGAKHAVRLGAFLAIELWHQQYLD